MTKSKAASKMIPHGTLGGYTNHKCRCDDCMKVHREYQREYMGGNAHQRRLAVLRERVRYWKREIELREFRGQTHGRMSAAKARAQLERYNKMYEDLRTGKLDSDLADEPESAT